MCSSAYALHLVIVRRWKAKDLRDGSAGGYSMRLIIFFSFVLSLTISADTSIRVATPQSELELSTGYYLDLLSVVLDKTEQEYGSAKLVFEPVPVSGSLWKFVLNNKRIDVHWLTPSAAFESHLKRIPVEILYGGLGLRGLIIKESRQQEFLQVKTLDDLRRFTACQGEQWPDVQVLHYAGLKVHRVEKFESMLDMLRKGRCDYFPRSVIEGNTELAHQGYSEPEFVFLTSVLLYYPMPVHFYVDPQDKALYRRLELGLKAMHDSGELLSFMQQHPVTRHVFEAQRYKNSIVLTLHNPVLPSWYQADDFWLVLLGQKPEK